MYAGKALGVCDAEPGGDEAAPIAALGGEPAIAEDVRHERRERVGDLRDAEARLAGREGEAVARQGRRHHGEGVTGVATEARRVRQHRDDLVELADRPRPTVGEKQR